MFDQDLNDPDANGMLRASMGVCPQHDVLYDELTVVEHLDLFGALKGIASRTARSLSDQTLFDVQQLLVETDLSEKATSFAKNLSGGQKRKLSVAIALIGREYIEHRY